MRPIRRNAERAEEMGVLPYARVQPRHQGGTDMWGGSDAPMERRAALTPEQERLLRPLGIQSGMLRD